MSSGQQLVLDSAGTEWTMAHPNKHIRKAIEFAIRNGWEEREAGPRSHAYCHLFAPDGETIFRVRSTPRNPENHAKHLIRAVASLLDD